MEKGMEKAKVKQKSGLSTAEKIKNRSYMMNYLRGSTSKYFLTSMSAKKNEMDERNKNEQITCCSNRKSA